MNNEPKLIGETAFHHEGDLDFMMSLIDECAKSDFDSIKFQVSSDINLLIAQNHSAYKTLYSFIFSKKEWIKIFKYAIEKSLKLVILPLDVPSIEWALEFKTNIALFEIHSVSFYDQELIEALVKTKMPIMLGIGGRTLDEINDKIKVFGDNLKVLMHGYQAFPSSLKEVKLWKIKELTELYPNLIIGYADHSKFDSSMGIKSFEFAYCLGARCFEKHITSKEGIERTDYIAAVESKKLVDIKKRIFYLEELNTINKKELFEVFSESETQYRNRQKFAVAITEIRQGEEFSSKNVRLLMTDKGSGISDFNIIKGKTAIKNIDLHSVLSLNDIK